MRTLKIHIVEDEKLIGESLKEILECLNHEVIAISTSVKQALDNLKKDTPDLMLLDIQLEGEKDGIDLAHELDANHDIPFIFTTAFADESTIGRAKEESPYGYIVKPYGIKDINAAIEIAMSNFDKIQSMKSQGEDALVKSKNIYLKVDYRLVKVHEDEIHWIEAKGDYAVFKTDEKSYIVKTTIKNVIEKLDKFKFLKVHRSFIVNLDKVVDIEDSTLLIDKKIIPISRANKEALMERIHLI